MKQKLAKALHRHAEQELMKVFPEAELKVFEPVSDTFIGNLLRDLPLEEARKRAREIETLPESCLCWVLNPKSQLKFYVVLLVAPKDDSFTFEIGWNKQGRLPRSRGRHPGEEGDATECSIRIGRFGVPRRMRIGGTLAAGGHHRISSLEFQTILCPLNWLMFNRNWPMRSKRSNNTPCLTFAPLPSDMERSWWRRKLVFAA